MPPKEPLILVAEDDQALLRWVRRSLELTGYRVITAEDGVTALELAANPELALIVLDIAMPGLDGLTVCRRVREFSEVYIIMATAASSEEQMVAGLDAGADDYITKPFSTDQLVARVRAVLRRMRQGTPRVEPRYEFEGLVVDFVARRVAVEDRELHLTPTEYQLVATLATNPGVVLTHMQILERVWGRESASDRHMLQVNVGRIRRKLEADPDQPRYLLTRPGVGYYMPRPT